MSLINSYLIPPSIQGLRSCVFESKTLGNFFTIFNRCVSAILERSDAASYSYSCVKGSGSAKYLALFISMVVIGVIAFDALYEKATVKQRHAQ